MSLPMFFIVRQSLGVLDVTTRACLYTLWFQMQCLPLHRVNEKLAVVILISICLCSFIRKVKRKKRKRNQPSRTQVPSSPASSLWFISAHHGESMNSSSNPRWWTNRNPCNQETVPSHSAEVRNSSQIRSERMRCFAWFFHILQHRTPLPTP